MTRIHFLSRNVILNIDHLKPNKILNGEDYSNLLTLEVPLNCACYHCGADFI